MKARLVGVLAVAALSAFLVAADEQGKASKADAEGFISLFDGKTLDGWEGMEGFWSVKDGAINGHETKEHSAQTFLVYKDRHFSDFELHAKYRFVSKDGNSGIQFRSKVIDPKTFRVGGYQGDMDGAHVYDGGIYDEAGVAGGRGIMAKRGYKTVWKEDGSKQEEKLDKSDDDIKKLVKENDWNDYVLVAKGNHVTISLNGTVTCEMTDDSPHALKDGVLALQLHQGFTMEVQFKDVKIKPLDGK